MNRFAWVLIPVLALAPAWAQAADSSSGETQKASSASERTLVLCGKVVSDGKQASITDLYKPGTDGKCNKGDAVLTTTIHKDKR